MRFNFAESLNKVSLFPFTPKLLSVLFLPIPCGLFDVTHEELSKGSLLDSLELNEFVEGSCLKAFHFWSMECLLIMLVFFQSNITCPFLRWTIYYFYCNNFVLHTVQYAIQAYCNTSMLVFSQAKIQVKIQAYLGGRFAFRKLLQKEKKEMQSKQEEET